MNVKTWYINKKKFYQVKLSLLINTKSNKKKETKNYNIV